MQSQDESRQKTEGQATTVVSQAWAPTHQRQPIMHQVSHQVRKPCQEFWLVPSTLMAGNSGIFLFPKRTNIPDRFQRATKYTKNYRNKFLDTEVNDFSSTL